MKKNILLMLLFVMAAMTATAQEAPGARERVAEIRKLYAEAKEMIAQIPTKVEDGRPSDDMVVNINYMAPGAGPISDVTHYYFNGDFDEELNCVYYKPYFVTRKFNVGALEYYQEFLYNSEGEVAFFYEKIFMEPVAEARYYYDKFSVVHKIAQGEGSTDEMYAMRMAQDLIDAFNKLQNRIYE